MTLSKLPNERDAIGIRQAIQRLNKKIGQTAAPTWGAISVIGGASFGSIVAFNTITANQATVSVGVFSSATISTLGVTSGNVVEGWAVGSTLTAAAISVLGTVSGGAGIFTTISTGAGSFTSVDASGGIAVTSNLHVAAISASGTISGGAGILTTISAGAASFSSVDATGVALTSIVTLADTTTSGLGVIYKGASSFLHNFHHPTGSTAVPLGRNVFVGGSAGNFTMGSTATITAHASDNVGLGAFALRILTTGFGNMAIGTNALFSATTATENMAIGKSALYSAVSAGVNLAIGTESLFSLVTTQNNIGLGYQSGLYTTGWGNILIGGKAGRGTSGNSYYNYTVAVGHNAAYSLQSNADNNSLLGFQSGYLLTTGSSNLFFGYKSGYNQTTNSNLLIIDNQDRTSAALEITNSLIYGIFAAAPANQTLRFNGVVTFSQDIVLPTVTGTKIGTATTQLLGFYGTTPVDQPATVADPTGGLVIDTEARAAISALIDRLQETGLIA